MIIKELQEPENLQAAQALLNRLPVYHQKHQEIEQDYKKRKAGFAGEKALDYYLKQLPFRDFLIMHDLRLCNGSHFFQIDILILIPKLIFLVEVKNITGTLFFDRDFHQLIRTADGKRERFQDPLIQINEHKDQLRTWLAHHHLDLPVEELVCISNNHAIIEATAGDNYVRDRVVHLDRLKPRILETEKKLSFFKPRLSDDDKTFQAAAKSKSALYSYHSPNSLYFQTRVDPRRPVSGMPWLCHDQAKPVLALSQL